LLVLALSLTLAAPALAARISGIGLVDYRRKNFKIGDWVRYQIDVANSNGREERFFQEVRIVGDEVFRGENCFWMETWFGQDSTNAGYDLSLVSYEAFKDKQSDVRFSIYMRMMMFEMGEDGSPSMTEVRRANPTGPLPDLAHMRGEVDTLGYEKVESPKGIVDAQVVTLHRKLRNPHDLPDSTINKITDMHRKQWLSRKVPITSLVKEEETEDWLVQSYKLGEVSTSAPEVLVSSEVRKVEVVAWGTGAKSRLLDAWRKKKKSADGPSISAPAPPGGQ
jgi:hypothetical protein